MPEVREYFSSNKRFKLTVYPRPLENQLRFWEDKDLGKPNPGASPGVLTSSASALLSEKHWWGYKRLNQLPLLNEVSPVDALVSDDGQRIITFDNWHTVGYGPNVIVFYSGEGKCIKSYGLEDFLTPGDIQTLSRSVSSIWWGGKHQINETTGRLILKIISPKENTSSAETFIDVPFSLATGQPIEPLRDRISKGERYRSVIVTDAVQPNESAVGFGEWLHSENHLKPTKEFISPITSSLALSQGIHLNPPKYPPLASLARIRGTVVLELLISSSGTVLSVRALSGPIQLRASAAQAAIKWQFQPSTESNEIRNTILAVEFGKENVPYHPN